MSPEQAVQIGRKRQERLKNRTSKRCERGRAWAVSGFEDLMVHSMGKADIKKVAYSGTGQFPSSDTLGAVEYWAADDP